MIILAKSTINATLNVTLSVTGTVTPSTLLQAIEQVDKFKEELTERFIAMTTQDKEETPFEKLSKQMQADFEQAIGRIVFVPKA